MDGNEFFAVIAGESSGCFQPTAAAFNVSTSDSDHSPDGLHKRYNTAVEVLTVSEFTIDI